MAQEEKVKEICKYYTHRIDCILERLFKQKQYMSVIEIAEYRAKVQAMLDIVRDLERIDWSVQS